MGMLRVDKIIAATGLYSRREVKLLVRQGRVLADGRVVTSAEEKIDPEATELLLRGAVYAGVYGLAACVSGTAELCVPESLRPARRAEKARALR